MQGSHYKWHCKNLVFVSYCQCYPSESEQITLWCNLTSHLFLSLAILDESVKTLSSHFKKIKQLLEQKKTSHAVFRQSKTNLHQMNKLHKRFTWVELFCLCTPLINNHIYSNHYLFKLRNIHKISKRKFTIQLN